MKRIAGVLALVFLVAFLAPSWAAPAPKADERAALTVFAAASLAEPFGELGHMLEASHPGLQVRFNFAGSQQLAAQIEQGSVADLFASADERWMEHLTQKEKIEGEPRVFARNGLVVIVPKSNPARIGSLPELAKRGVKVVLGSPATPVGTYSREALRKMGTLGLDFVPNYAQRVMSNVVSEEDNVKSVVTKVQLGEADAGMVYRSDVTPSVSRNVRVFELPPAAQIVANYPIAAVKGSAHAEAAQAFLALLASKEGRAVIERCRLSAVPPETP